MPTRNTSGACCHDAWNFEECDRGWRALHCIACQNRGLTMLLGLCDLIPSVSESNMHLSTECVCSCVRTCNSSSIRWTAEKAANVAVQVPHKQEYLHSSKDLKILRGSGEKLKELESQVRRW